MWSGTWVYPAAPQLETAHAQARAVEPAGITSSARQRQSWAIRGPLALCPTALAGPVKGSSSSPVRCSGCVLSKEPPCPQQSGRPATAPIRNRPIVVTSDQSRPSILSGPSLSGSLPSLLLPVLSPFHPSHAPSAASHHLFVRIALFDLLETRRMHPVSSAADRV